MDQKNFEEYPLSRSEYISAMVHLYRGELNRANIWRTRLDTTSNWAVLSAMGLLSFAFSQPQHSHSAILVAMLATLHFMLMEARRYRFFDVWRNRVRMIEENFYGPILTRELHSPARNWGNLVAGDLLDPRFKITFFQAVRVRLLRNYLPVFGILLAAWMVKMRNFGPDIDWRDRLSLGVMPWPITLAIISGLYLFLAGLIVFVSRVRPPEESYWSSKDNLMGQRSEF